MSLSIVVALSLKRFDTEAQLINGSMFVFRHAPLRAPPVHSFNAYNV